MSAHELNEGTAVEITRNHARFFGGPSTPAITIEAITNVLDAKDANVAALVKAARHLLDDGWDCHPDKIACAPELQKALSAFPEEQ